MEDVIPHPSIVMIIIPALRIIATPMALAPILQKIVLIPMPVLMISVNNLQVTVCIYLSRVLITIAVLKIVAAPTGFANLLL
jgi:hypothetical protein